jgi:hypothetical protein
MYRYQKYFFKKKYFFNTFLNKNRLQLYFQICLEFGVKGGFLFYIKPEMGLKMTSSIIKKTRIYNIFYLHNNTIIHNAKIFFKSILILNFT